MTQTQIKCEKCGKEFKKERSLITHQQFHCKGSAEKSGGDQQKGKCQHDMRLIPSRTQNILMQRALNAGYRKYCVHCGGLE